MNKKIIAIFLSIGIIGSIFLGQQSRYVLFHENMISAQQEPTQMIIQAELGERGIPEHLQGKLRLFVLAGQSNMSGRGDVQVYNVKEDSYIYVFGNDYHWRLAAEPLDDPKNQVDQVSLDLEAGFGPGLTFAVTLSEKRPEEYSAIGLIPCAKGASSIHEWQRSLDDNTLYGSCLKRVRAASLMGEVAGLIFFQGETDAIDPILFPEKTLLPETWAVEFEIFVEDWRRDMRNLNFPIVFAQIGNTTSPDRYINWEVVQQQQRSVGIENVKMIVTEDLPLKDDVHFTNKSYQIIGERFAEAYLSLKSK